MIVRRASPTAAGTIRLRPLSRANLDFDRIFHEANLLVDEPLDRMNATKDSLHLHRSSPPVGSVSKTNVPEPRTVPHLAPLTALAGVRLSSPRLAKRSRALRARNRQGIADPTVRRRHWPRSPTRTAGLSSVPIGHGGHASKNPGVWSKAPDPQFFNPRILPKSLPS